ncbi:MAG: hypothetical protein HQM08_07325 [Candidatus Riflebacteria bacterium]|nr:hypothetical protein [Candidatus Riflebacteria bacterium]
MSKPIPDTRKQSFIFRYNLFRISPGKKCSFTNYKESISYGILVLFMLGAFQLNASQPLVPEWYRFSAELAEIPSLGSKATLKATLTSLIGNISGIEVRISLPEGWKYSEKVQKLENLSSGTSHVFTFEAEASVAAPNGSIICTCAGSIPKAELTKVVQDMPFVSAELLPRVSHLPGRFVTNDEIAFSLYPEEGFYPLGPDMWLGYDDRLKNPAWERGPVFYRESVISAAQAGLNIEMYSKLEKKLSEDPSFGNLLRSKGIDPKNKQLDTLRAYYVIAQEAYLKKDLKGVDENLKSFDRLSVNLPEGMTAEIKIAAKNLQALAMWHAGEKKKAEEILREAFYSNRKLPVQRYVLRNLGLLAQDRGDTSVARESYRIGLTLKSAYSLLKREFERLDQR